MCGIVACSGKRTLSEVCVEGLKRLQYRGYDSYGFAWAAGDRLERLRSLEPLGDMVEHLPDARAVVGHTRWATHGGVTLENCHPQIAGDNEFALVHNGIVENYQQLGADLAASGTSFSSGTDTEVIVRLLAAQLREIGDRKQAFMETMRRLEGRNTVVVLFPDEEIYGVRQGSPLVLGDSGEAFFLASDMLSFAPWASRCFALPDNTIVRIWNYRCEGFHQDGTPLAIAWSQAEVDHEDTGLDDYPHYMLKEVMEQWRTVAQQAIVGDGELDELVAAVRAANTIIVTGAGGAYYAAAQIAWLLREVAHVRALAVQAYEMETMACCIAPGDVLLAVSQSGETADTIEAVRMAARWGMRVASLVNMPFSTLTGFAEFKFHNRSGPEICVLSTKSATAQITFGVLLAHALNDDVVTARAAIDELSRELTHYLTPGRAAAIERTAARIAGHDHIFVLGRGGYFGSALMTALNIKEASYIHAEAFTAGELKHGVIALIEEGVPVILITPGADAYMINAAAEVKSRGAFLIGVADEENELFDRFIPLPAITGSARAVSSIIPGQLLAYYLAVNRGVNPDKPRNLAKSVTVQ